jgi:outer membrane protein assembly factor BamB
LAASGAVVTAAVVAIALFAAPVAVDDPFTPIAAPQPVATVPVGDAPTAMVTGANETIWVTRAESRTVSRIDPVSEEVVDEIPLTGRPEEIVEGHGSVWIADDSGVVTRVSVANEADGVFTNSEAITVVEGEDVHLDLAATKDGIVAVDQDSGAAYALTVEGTGGGSLEPFLPDFGATDVASGDEGTWLLDGPDGELTNGRETFSVPSGFNADLAVGAGKVWVASGTEGGVYGIDPSTGAIVVSAEVGGRYTDLAVDSNSVWALTGGDGPDRLHQIDARTGKIVGEPLEMEGDPRDVTASDGSAWVADGDGAEVVRIDPVEDADLPRPDATEPTPDRGGPVDPNDVVFVFSADGDLFAQTGEEVVQLTRTPEAEIHPSISADGRYIAFERGDEDTGQTVGILDLTTGEECCLREGAWPAFGPHNQLAWVVPVHGLVEADEQAMIAIGPLEGPAVKQVSAAPPDVGVQFSVKNLAWDQTGEVLAYEAGYEGTAIRLLDLILDSDGLVKGAEGPETIPVEGSESGAVYTGVSSAFEFHVLRACCRLTEGDAYDEEVELGELSADAEQDYPFRTLFDLSEAGLRLKDQTLFTVYTGLLATEGSEGDDVVFREGNDPSWLIGDGMHLWLGSTDSFVQLPYEVHGGAAAPDPNFDS